MTWGNSWALSEKRGNKILLSAPLCLLINTLYVGFSQSSWVAWKPHPDGKNPRKDYAKKYLGHVYHFCTFMYMHTCVACRHKIMSNIKWEVQHYANLWLYIFVLTLKLEKIHIYPRLCYLLRGPTSVLRFSPGDLGKKNLHLWLQIYHHSPEGYPKWLSADSSKKMHYQNTTSSSN